MTKRIVFYAQDKDYWYTFYTEDGEIYGIVLPKKEWPTLKSFKQMIRKCEDAPIEPEELVGITIIDVKEVE
jgi:hypothetical protein